MVRLEDASGLSEPTTGAPSDGGNGFLRTAQLSNASAFRWRFTKTFPTGKTSSKTDTYWHSDYRREELRALLERGHSEHPPALLRWLRVRLGGID
jgi:hypothetical protein